MINWLYNFDVNSVITKPVYIEVPIYPNSIETIRRIYPNIREIAIYIDEYMDDRLIDHIASAVRDGINIIFYTMDRSNRLKNIFHSSIEIRYID